jgi:L-ornithine Nalpha-acyltransferase
MIFNSGLMRRLQNALTPWKMRTPDTGRHMRVDRLADPKSSSAEFCNPQDVSWAPEWLARHFGAERLRKSGKTAAPLKLGVIGPLEVRLARHKRDVRRLQRLRYHVFYKHGRAVADIATRFTRRDKDSFDSICDHLMVVDHSARPLTVGRSPVIGTYRLLRQDMAEKHGGFYSAEEFDISGLLRRQSESRFLELGRSCVLPSYRTKRTIELLWRGVWSYVQEQHVDVMIGCASLEGTDISRLARPLSFLHHFARAPDAWCAAAHSLRRVEMNRMPKKEIDVKAAWHELPPLIKGYLRVGAFVGDGAVIDPKFGTTDVLIIMPVSLISARYIDRFGMDTKRYAGQWEHLRRQVRLVS